MAQGGRKKIFAKNKTRATPSVCLSAVISGWIWLVEKKIMPWLELLKAAKVEPDFL